MDRRDRRHPLLEKRGGGEKKRRGPGGPRPPGRGGPPRRALGQSEGAAPMNAPVSLVEGDLLDDPGLMPLLAGPFDAMVAWLLDTHDARGAHKKMLELRVASPDEYKMRAQGTAYEYAAKLLRPGGTL